MEGRGKHVTINENGQRYPIYSFLLCLHIYFCEINGIIITIYNNI